MPIETLSLEEITDRNVDSYRGAFPDDDVSRFSDNFKRLRVISAAEFQLNHHIEVVSDDVLPDTAAGTLLDRQGEIFNVTRKPATPARKSDSGRITGVAASAFAIGNELISAGGLRFQVNENGVIPASLFIDVDIIGIDTGEQTKLQAGETLEFTTPPAGIDKDVILVLDLDEDGEDQEADGQYRQRILNAIRQPGAGGNSNDWENFALEEDGISSAYVYPTRGGLGTVHVAALHAGTGSVRLLTAPEIADLTLAIEDKRPVQVKSFLVPEVTTTEEDVEMTIKERPGSEFAFDWDDSSGALALDAATPWTPAGFILKFDLDRPTDMRAGDRIVIKTAAGDGTGEQFVIEALGPASDEVQLAKAPDPVPVAADVVYSGGPLVDTVRDAVLDFMNSLGPAIGDFGVGNWISDLVPERLIAIALIAESGIRDATVVTPVATVVPDDPAFPLNTTVELIIPGEIVIRRTP